MSKNDFSIAVKTTDITAKDLSYGNVEIDQLSYMRLHFTDEQVEWIFGVLGMNLAQMYELRYMWEKEGKNVKKFVLPSPKVKMFGIPVVFAEIDSPTVEIEE